MSAQVSDGWKVKSDIVGQAAGAGHRRKEREPDKDIFNTFDRSVSMQRVYE